MNSRFNAAQAAKSLVRNFFLKAGLNKNCLYTCSSKPSLSYSVCCTGVCDFLLVKVPHK